jgi:ABC-2 type transport system permease protein
VIAAALEVTRPEKSFGKKKVLDGIDLAIPRGSVSSDMSEGIINRYRTMRMSRLSVLTGQVLCSVIWTLVSAVFVVAIAVASGFRSSASRVAWFSTIGLFVLVTLALAWLAVAFGLYA